MRSDGTFYILRYPERLFENLKQDWHAFQRVEPRSREAIVDALLEDHNFRSSMLRYRDESISEYLAEREASDISTTAGHNLLAAIPRVEE